MLLGFKKQFAVFVEQGSKTHTIRAKRKRPPHVGEVAHCYTGLRQKGARCLGRFEVVKIDTIWIDVAEGLQIQIGGAGLSIDEMLEFARRDGFRSTLPINEMRDFWIQNHGTDLFVGDIIHWKFKPGTANAKPKAPKRRAGGKE